MTSPQLDASPGLDELDRARLVGDRDGASSTSNTRSKLTIDVITSTRALVRPVSGAYTRPTSDASATSVPVVIAAADHRLGAEAVDRRRADRADEAEGDEEHTADDRRLHPDVAHAGGAGRRTCRPRGAWLPNSLTSSAPDTLKRSLIWVFISALSTMPRRLIACDATPDALGRDDEQGQHEQCQQREAPVEGEHGGERGDEHDRSR